jgi:hypothetical protein
MSEQRRVATSTTSPCSRLRLVTSSTRNNHGANDSENKSAASAGLTARTGKARLDTSARMMLVAATALAKMAGNTIMKAVIMKIIFIQVPRMRAKRDTTSDHRREAAAIVAAARTTNVHRKFPYPGKSRLAALADSHLRCLPVFHSKR